MTWSHPALETIVGLVGQRTGLQFPPGRQAQAEEGIQRARKRSAIATLEEYRDRITTEPALLDDLVSELTIGETYFFRESAQFEFLRREVLPALRQRGPGHPIRVWSAGCASGEEAYSLAILLEEEGLAGQAHVLATDISRSSLARARQAVYSSWSLRDNSGLTGLARRYLRQHGKRFHLAETIRQRVVFQCHNLVLDACPSFAGGAWGMDLILCRNVLIYFAAEATALVARRLFEALAPTGWLITASSDPPLQESAPFEVVIRNEGVFYRRPGEERLAATRSGEERSAPPRSGARPPDDALRCAAAPLRVAANPNPDPSSALHQVRALANQDPAAAEQACAALVQRDPLAPELHFLHAILLIDLGRE